MMSVNFAYIRRHITKRRFVRAAIFVATATKSEVRSPYQILSELRAAVKQENMPIDTTAIVISENGKLRFYGDNCLVDLLNQCGLPRPTHTLAV